MYHRGTVLCTEDWQTTFYLLLERSVQLTKWHGHSILLDAECAEGLRSQLLMLTWYVVYWSALHLILDSEWIWYSLLLELKTPTLVRHCVYCALTLSSLFSPSDENIQLGNLGGEFELAEDIWWREHIKLWVLGQQDALALWGQWSYLSILFVWRFVWWDVSALWGQYLHHRHRALWDRCLSSTRTTSLFF